MKSADALHPDWSERAYTRLLDFIRERGRGSLFMVEDFRAWCAGKLPEPPSLRAYGGLIVRAKKAGLVACRGTEQVKNVRAHRANAAVWQVINIA